MQPQNHLELSHSIASERALCSCLLAYPDMIDSIADTVSHDSLYDHSLRSIFRAIQSLHADGIGIGLPEIVSRIERDESMLYHQAHSLLSMLVDAIYSVRDCQYHARNVAQYAMLRDMQRALHTAHMVCQKNPSPYEAVKSARAIIDAVILSSDETWPSIADGNPEYLSGIDDAQSFNADNQLKTGLAFIDQHIYLRGPLLVVIGARPSHGKTAMALTWIRNLCQSGRPVGLMTLEMPRFAIQDRFVSMATGIPLPLLRRPKGLSEMQRSRMNDAVKAMESWQLFIEEGVNAPGDIVRKGRRMVSLNAEVLFIDQLSMIKAGSDRHNLTEDYADRVAQIAQLRKELGIPVVLLVQANRKVEELPAAKRLPALHHFKQTGAIEEMADIIVTILRPVVYKTELDEKLKRWERLPQFVKFAILKNRQGMIVDSKDAIMFSPDHVMFTNGLPQV